MRIYIHIYNIHKAMKCLCFVARSLLIFASRDRSIENFGRFDAECFGFCALNCAIVLKDSRELESWLSQKLRETMTVRSLATLSLSVLVWNKEYRKAGGLRYYILSI